MSTHRFAPVMRRGTGLLVLFLLSGLLIAQQLLLSSIAFANAHASRGRNGHALSQQQQEALDVASVSVVRLVVTYNTIGTNPQPSGVACTGLGSLVGSWLPRNLTDANNWVLTDSSLVHLSGTTCTGNAGQLASIIIYPNTTYTNSQAVPLPLAQLLCSPAGCHDGPPGTAATETITPAGGIAGGGAIFSFHTDAQHVQPFLDVAQPGASATGTLLGIELTSDPSATGKWPQSAVVANTSGPTKFLVPNPITSTTSNVPGNAPTAIATPTNSPTSGLPRQYYEPGMPVVGTNGTLIGMHLSGNGQNLLPLTQISDLMRTQLDLQPVALAFFKNANPLYKNWVAGVTDYYNHEYRAADTALKAITNTKSEFQAPRDFDAKYVVPALQGSEPGKSPTPASGNTVNATILGLPTQLVIMVGVIVGLIILILLLVVVSLTFGRARARRRRELAQFKIDQAEAQRMAEMAAQQPKITARLQSPFSTVHCPNCGVQVTANDSVCPNCHYLLSASDSGLHLRAVVPPTVEPAPQASPMQPVPAPIPASSISDMPTIQFPPGNPALTVVLNVSTSPMKITSSQYRRPDPITPSHKSLVCLSWLMVWEVMRTDRMPAAWRFRRLSILCCRSSQAAIQ